MGEHEKSQSELPTIGTGSHAAQPYRGRFAPSPTGPLHRGSLVAALASWLDARSHQGKWLIRIENVDTPRERPGAAERQLQQLQQYGLVADEAPLMQSTRFPDYEDALESLRGAGLTYVCHCTRAQLEANAAVSAAVSAAASAAASAAPSAAASAPVNAETNTDAGADAGAAGAAYDGTCRGRGLSLPGAVRMIAAEGEVQFVDRALGSFRQDVARAVGDFIVRRSDGLWAYQLAVVVDDAAQGITDVVRGADLLDNTPRQILLQRALGLPTPRYLHVPLVLDAAGRKLSKQEQAQPLGARTPLEELEQAFAHLGFAPSFASSVAQFHEHAIAAWGRRFGAVAVAPGAAARAGGPPPEH